MSEQTTTTPTAAGAAIDDLPQLWDGFAKLVRAGLGITAFGVQIMDLPPDYSTESHDESDTGQQELYVALRGSGAVVTGDGDLALDARVDRGRICVELRCGKNRDRRDGTRTLRSRR